jgi:hypothetical protein
MRRNGAVGLFAIVLCVGVGCGDDGGATDSGDGLTDAREDGIDCSGASAASGEGPAMSTCAIAGCHNADFAGQRGGGGFASSNLTPHPTGLAGWSTGDIARATLDGVTPEGEVLCPIMIRYRTAGLSEEEACDIAAFLQSLDPIDNEVPDTCE